MFGLLVIILITNPFVGDAIDNDNVSPGKAIFDPPREIMLYDTQTIFAMVTRSNITTGDLINVSHQMDFGCGI